MPRLTNMIVIYGLLHSGANVTNAAAPFGVNRRTIQRLQHIFTETDSTDKPANVKTSLCDVRSQNRFLVVSNAHDQISAAIRSACKVSSPWNISASHLTGMLIAIHSIVMQDKLTQDHVQKWCSWTFGATIIFLFCPGHPRVLALIQ